MQLLIALEGNQFAHTVVALLAQSNVFEKEILVSSQRSIVRVRAQLEGLAQKDWHTRVTLLDLVVHLQLHGVLAS